MRSLLFVLLLTGCACGESPLYTTKCGLEFYGDVDTHQPVTGWDAATFQRVEDIYLNVFPQVVTDPAFATSKAICEQFHNWKVVVHPAKQWPDPFDRTPSVSGLTYCDQATSIIDLDDWYNTSVYHELSHAVQRCNPPLAIDATTDLDHSNWVRDHIYSAIEQAKELR